MREEEECEPGCYRLIYFLHDCYEKIISGERKRRREQHMDFDED